MGSMTMVDKKINLELNKLQCEILIDALTSIIIYNDEKISKEKKNTNNKEYIKILNLNNTYIESIKDYIKNKFKEN